MRNVKSIVGVAAALLPVLYFGYLGYYFFDVAGSVEEAQTIGLGPTILGLGIVVLLFCIPLAIKIVRLFGGPRTPGAGGRGGPDDSNPDGDFDPDAVIARYMARQSKQPASGSAPHPLASASVAPASSAPRNHGPARPASFGRKTR